MPDKAKQALLNKARLDKFILSLTVPEALKSTVSKVERAVRHHSTPRAMPDMLQFSIYGVVVPSVTVLSNALPYTGQELKVTSHARSSYEDVTVNFTVDNQFNNYWYIWRWLDVLNDNKVGGYDARNETLPRRLLEDYQTNFTIFGLNEYNKNTIEFTYTKAFPISLGEMMFNYRTTDEVECSLTFSFSQLHVNLL